MEFFFSKVFWGLVVILVGLSIVLNSVFKINLPVFKILLAGFFIFIGVRMLLDSFGVRNNMNVFGDQHVKIEQIDNQKFDVVFGSQVIDLSHGQLTQNNSRVECDVVFGSAKIFIDKDMDVRIKSSSVFGSVKPPNGNETVFGSDEYTSRTDSSDNTLILEVNAVFGSAQIFER